MHDHKADDFDWLIEGRARIQRLAHRFYKAMRSGRPKIDRNGRLRAVALLGTGACFSLWRAIYLAHADKQWVENVPAAERFLEDALHMKSILFSDDIEASTWMFGYYLNNAYFRLREIFDQVPEIYRHLGESRSSAKDNAKEVWDKYCEALETIAGHLESHLNEGPLCAAAFRLQSLPADRFPM